MSDERKCPFCGAEKVTPDAFDCWTHIINVTPGYHRGRMCYERQIAAQQELLALHRAFLSDMRPADREAYARTCPHAKALIEKGEWPV